MIPALTETGRSFKGAASYYLHDKPASAASPGTADRVAWTETLNLPTTDPDRAWRMMAHTAMAEGALKTLAGVKRTGRKLEKPVLAYSLSWHPSEQPSKAEQLAAAKESLRALGLQEHQAIIVCHTDEPQPHVHVMANRVHPMTGRAAPLSKSKLALSAWAQAYEERQGRVFCGVRVENNARRDGTAPGRVADHRSRRVSRAEWEAGGRDRPAASALRQRHAALFSAERGAAGRAAGVRRAEIEAFRASQQAGRRAIRAQAASRPLTPEQAATQARLAAVLASPRPAAALAALTRDRSTFTRAELERFVARHTADAAGFAAALAALDASGELIRVGQDERRRDRFTTAAHQAIERRMVELATRLGRSPAAKGRVPARFKGWSLSADQLAALAHVLDPARLAAVEGIAGTGKSTMLDAARQSWEAAGLRVQGLALAAEAAHGLQTGSGIASGTIHGRLFQWEQGRNRPGPGDVIVVDEAGMVGSRQMERLLHFAAEGGARIVLVGGARQLQAIEAGGAFRAIAARLGAATLTTVRRQKAAWQRAATAELADGRTATALARYEAAGTMHGHATGAEAMAALIAAWDRARVEQPGRTQLVMAFLRRDVAALNAHARACLQRDGTLGVDVTLDTAAGRLPFATGDRLAFQRNDAKLGVRNGSLGTVEAIHGRRLTVRLDGDPARRVAFGLDEYGHIAHGYAATIHKSQGATVDRAHLYVSPNLDQHAAYVAMSRHRDRLDIHWSRDTIPTRAKLDAVLSRLALKDTSLDYADDQAAEAEARRDASASMRARIQTRAAAFAERERTTAGRMANARALLPAGASPLAIARLALDAVERLRLFRLRQGRLRQWARKILPAGSAAPAHPRPAQAERHLAGCDHAAVSLRLLETMEARHRAERRQERETRAALQRQAARDWQDEAERGQAEATIARHAGNGVIHWRAAQREANDNRPAPLTPSPRPRPF